MFSAKRITGKNELRDALLFEGGEDTPIDPDTNADLTCCCCFPAITGMKVLTVLSILGALDGAFKTTQAGLSYSIVAIP